MLSDAQILGALKWGKLEISPFRHERLQAASYDVSLHPGLQVMQPGSTPIDPKADSAEHWNSVTMDETHGWVLQPGQFALASTQERFALIGALVGQLEGKSSLGRLGLMVHSTAGYIDPGFRGQVTLELSCVAPRGITLYPGMPIGQMAFTHTGPVETPYRGKYVGQDGPTLSRYHENWDGEAWL